jgi:hypothetical protein
MQACGGVEVKLHAFLTSVLEGGEYLVSRPCRLIPEDRTLIPNEQKIGLAPGRCERCGEDKYPVLPGIELRSLTCSLVTVCTMGN